jgi:hypothetical protein
MTAEIKELSCQELHLKIPFLRHGLMCHCQILNQVELQLFAPFATSVVNSFQRYS